MRLFIRLVAGLILLVLIGLMVGPFSEAQASTGIWDKAAHVVAFAVIPICLAIDFPFGRLSTLAAVSLALGGSVEIVQGWVGRDASWGDLAADAVGIMIAVVILGALRWRGARKVARAAREAA